MGARILEPGVRASADRPYDSRELMPGPTPQRQCPVCGQSDRGPRCPRDDAPLQSIGVPPLPPEALPLGETIADRWRVDAAIGPSPDGRRFSGFDLVRLETVEIEVPHLADEASVGAFLRGASRATRFEHPALLGVIDAAHDPRGFAFSVERPQLGRPLARVVSERLAGGVRFTEAEVARLGRDVLDGLEAAHRAGIAHGDLQATRVALSDDGASLVLRGFATAELRGRSGMSAVRVEYAAPERIRGAPPSVAADVYAVGVLLYLLVGGQLPFRGSTPEATARMILQSAPPDLRRVPRVNASEALLALLESALEKDASARPPSAAALRDRLAALAPAGGFSPVAWLEEADASTAAQLDLLDGPTFATPTQDPFAGGGDTLIPDPNGSAASSGGLLGGLRLDPGELRTVSAPALAHDSSVTQPMEVLARPAGFGTTAPEERPPGAIGPGEAFRPSGAVATGAPSRPVSTGDADPTDPPSEPPRPARPPDLRDGAGADERARTTLVTGPAALEPASPPATRGGLPRTWWLAFAGVAAVSAAAALWWLGGG